MEQSHNKLISMIIGIVVVALIVVALVWLSDRGALGTNIDGVDGQNLSEEEVAAILEELSQPATGADGKPLTAPTSAETAAIMAELATPTTNTAPTQAEIDATLKALQAN